MVSTAQNVSGRLCQLWRWLASIYSHSNPTPSSTQSTTFQGSPFFFFIIFFIFFLYPSLLIPILYCHIYAGNKNGNPSALLVWICVGIFTKGLTSSLNSSRLSVLRSPMISFGAYYNGESKPTSRSSPDTGTRLSCIRAQADEECGERRRRSVCNGG